MNEQLTEFELLKLASAGDRRAFSALYTQYIHQLYQYVFSICNCKESSEEIVQDLFLKLWENKESLIYVTSFKSYLYRASKNLLLNQLKRKKAESQYITNLEMANQTTEDSSDNLIYKDYERIASHAIGLLPERRKLIFKMRLDENLSLIEIATRLSISKSVVKKQLYSGISFVRNYVIQNGTLVIFLIMCWL